MRERDVPSLELPVSTVLRASVSYIIRSVNLVDSIYCVDQLDK